MTKFDFRRGWPSEYRKNGPGEVPLSSMKDSVAANGHKGPSVRPINTSTPRLTDLSLTF